jgi:hypothetical protein
MTDYDMHLALSPKYAHEIRNDPRFSPDKYNELVRFLSYEYSQGCITETRLIDAEWQFVWT